MINPTLEKFISCFLYMLPWSAAIPFGSFFLDISLLSFLQIPALPIIFIQSFIPFGSILLFLILFLCLIRNPKVSYFIKFNTMQAILLNISLIIIKFFFELLLQILGNSLLIRTLSSTILILMLSIIIFAIYECIQGKEPIIPGISEAVKIQL